MTAYNINAYYITDFWLRIPYTQDYKWKTFIEFGGNLETAEFIKKFP